MVDADQNLDVVQNLQIVGVVYHLEESHQKSFLVALVEEEDESCQPQGALVALEGILEV